MQVGFAQQWYDDLDSLAFSTPESESNVEEENDNPASFTPESESNFEEDNTTLGTPFQEDKVCIDCAVNTSPGTSEVCLLVIILLHVSCISFGSNRIFRGLITKT